MEPTKILDYNLLDTNTSIEYSIVLPIHNQELIIDEVLDRIFKNTTGSYELIVILDSCTDTTELKVISKLKKIPENLKNILVYKYDTPAFETTCDNFGFKKASAEYIIEIQADIYIYTYGYNKILTEPFRKYNDVLSVSGRCSHSLFNWSNGKGKLGDSIEKPLDMTYDMYDKFYIYDTCNRGPLALSKTKLEKLGYLDEQNFVLGDDDHDLNIRGNIQFGWVCGYVPIEIKSNLAEGSTRKSRDAINSRILDERRRRSNGGVLRKVLEKEISFNSKQEIRKL